MCLDSLSVWFRCARNLSEHASDVLIYHWPVRPSVHFIVHHGRWWPAVTTVFWLFPVMLQCYAMDVDVIIAIFLHCGHFVANCCKNKTLVSLSNCFKKYSHLKFLKFLKNFQTFLHKQYANKLPNINGEFIFSTRAANAYEASILDYGSATVRSRNTTAQLKRVFRFLEKFSHALRELLGNAMSAFTVPS